MRIALAVVMAMVAVPAWAQWVEVGKSGRSIFSSFNEDAYYIDPSTIVRDANFSRVWEIHDLKEKGTAGQRSILASVEYDCTAKRRRTLKATGRSQRMAKGEIVPLRGVYEEWIFLRPGKDDEKFLMILDRVCAP